MTVRIRPRSLRMRLTLWYTTVLAVLLMALGTTAFVLLDRGLRANVDTSLRSIADSIAESSRETTLAGADLEARLRALLGPAVAGRLFALLDPRGRPDTRLSQPPRDELPLSPTALRNTKTGHETFETIALPGAESVRLLTMPVTSGGRVRQLVQVALSLQPVEQARTRFLLILAALVPLALSGAAAGGWWLAGRALAPVGAMVEIARRITAEDLARRIDTPAADDELGRLAAVLNDMLGRLERAFAAARQFSADAAHELRTPLTILKGEIEVALGGTPDVSECRRVLSSCQEEVDRLTRLVEDLLFLARVDAGVVPPPAELVDLAAVVADASPALQALAERARVALAIEPAQPIGVRGSAPLLLRVLVNLVGNALKYTPAGGHVAVALTRRDGSAELVVRDDGRGIAPEERGRVFDRFYRGDRARTGDGAGLGLALVRSIVTVHGGQVTVESRQGGGSSFRVTLPAA